MRDYLEELLDRLTQEDEEEAAGVWETQAVSLILQGAGAAGGSGCGRHGLR